MDVDGFCTCPMANQYMDMTLLRCEFCGDNCATCQDTREKCTSCPTDLLMMPQSWTCHIQCPEGFVRSISRPDECELCH